MKTFCARMVVMAAHHANVLNITEHGSNGSFCYVYFTTIKKKKRVGPIYEYLPSLILQAIKHMPFGTPAQAPDLFHPSRKHH